MARDRRALIGSSIWDEPTICELTPYQQRCYFFVYTQRDLSRCGVIAYRPRKWAKKARGDSEDAMREAFTDLHTTRHVVLDDDGDELFVRTYLRHDGLLTQPMVVAGVVHAFQAVTSDPIRTAILTELRRLWTLDDIEPAERVGLQLLFGAPHPKPGVAKALGTALAGPLTKAIREGRVEGFEEGHIEGLPEGLVKACGEGTGQGKGTWLRNGTTGVPSPDPHADAVARTLDDDSGSSGDPRTDELLDTCGIVLADVRAKLRPTIDEALTGGVDPVTIKVALVNWHRRGAMPGLLAHLIEEYHGKSQTTTANGAPRPDWCHKCDHPDTRLVETDAGMRRCPDCHPAETQTVTT